MIEIVYRTPIIISNDEQEEIAYACRKKMGIVKNERYELYLGILSISE